jgi:hypothetical protein
VRRTDTVFRYGGDEFVAVLAPCDLATAKVVAERIRDAVEHKTFLAQEGLKLHFTVSIGVALFPDHATSKKAIIEAADHAMYSAKRATRNSVTIADISTVREVNPEKTLEPAPPLIPSQGPQPSKPRGKAPAQSGSIAAAAAAHVAAVIGTEAAEKPEAQPKPRPRKGSGQGAAGGR